MESALHSPLSYNEDKYKYNEEDAINILYVTQIHYLSRQQINFYSIIDLLTSKNKYYHNILIFKNFVFFLLSLMKRIIRENMPQLSYSLNYIIKSKILKRKIKMFPCCMRVSCFALYHGIFSKDSRSNAKRI